MDLQPYLCPLPDCHTAEATFSRRAHSEAHMISHKTPVTEQCPFCSVWEHLESPGCLSAYTKHIARHMEEIAFAVVTTPHEAWLYAETASAVSVNNT